MAEGPFCSFEKYSSTSCGNSSHYLLNKEYVALRSCNRDISNHLRRVKTSQTNIDGEWHLILLRVGLFEEQGETLTICPQHRDILGTLWNSSRLPTKCSHPLHGASNAKPDRGISAAFSKAILDHWGLFIPTGSGLCGRCRKLHSEELTRKETNKDQVLLPVVPASNELIPSLPAISDVTDETKALKLHLLTISSHLLHKHQAKKQKTRRYHHQTLESSFQKIYDSKGDEVDCQNHDVSIDDMNDSLSEVEISQEWFATPCFKTALKILNDFIRAVPNSRGKVDPVVRQLSIPWKDAAPSTQRYYKQKGQEVVQLALDCLAPGQATTLLAELISKEDAKVQNQRKESVESSELSRLVTLYEEANSWFTKRQILSVFVHDYTKARLQQIIPGLSIWAIDEARRHATKTGLGKLIPQTETLSRTRLAPNKVDHFLDFISRPNFLQDVAYGTKTLKLSNGDLIEIPNVVRTVIVSRLVDLYHRYCQETAFEPLGRSTLFSILQVCAASQKKSLAGLDNIATEGSQAFDTLEDVVNKLGNLGKSPSWTRDIKRRLKAGRCYLKTDFKVHVSTESLCADHCRVFALSDTDCDLKGTCLHEHTLSCASYDDLRNVLAEIEMALSCADVTFRYQEEKEELQHDVNNAIDKIEAWKAHILRAVHQDVAKDDILDCITPQQALIVMDWAMKFLPMKFRETQSEWFGKKGRSWHVTAVITKPREEFEVRTYVHLLDQCSQNWFSVASLYENTLTEVKRKSPEIVEAFARSDNTSCYHCALLLLSIHGISQRTGIVTSRYDFSESNSGKDICDRHISPMKSHIRQYVNAGHDVENASDMKRALDSYSGVRGCRASVVKVNTSAQQIHSHNWTGVQMFSNFQFSEGGIRMWKAYNIGQGKFVHYQKLTKKGGSQGDTRLVVIEPFTSPRMSVGCLQTVKSNKAKNSNDDDTNETCEFSCPQAGCIKLFKTSTAMQKHIDVGRHCFRPQKDSPYDTIKRKWAYACTSIRPSYVSSEESPRDLSVTDYPSVELGWGLKKSRRATRFSQQVKGYLMKLFLAGNRRETSATPPSLP